MPGDKVTASAYVLSEHDRWLLCDALYDILYDLVDTENRADFTRLLHFLAPTAWKVEHGF